MTQSAQNTKTLKTSLTTSIEAFERSTANEQPYMPVFLLNNAWLNTQDVKYTGE